MEIPQHEGTIPPAPVHSDAKGVSKKTMLIVAVIVGLASFAAGTRAQSLGLFQATKQSANARELDFTSVQQTYDALRNNFAGDPLDANKLIEGAKRGLVQAAGDPYTTYFSDEEAKQFLGDLEGTFTGIGAELSKKDNKLTVVSVLDDSPAKKAGVLASDVIVKVNDQDAADWSVDKAVSQIRGEKGTSVKLTVIRGGQDVKDFNITRDLITNPSVKYEVGADNIGYLRISRFAEGDTSILARKAAEDFKAKKVKGVVLDLRGNGGGYVTAAQDISSIWLGKGKTVVSERKDGQVIEELKTSGSSILEGVPTIVLIDGGSASASEIVAGALHDYKAATLVGEKSFGKGSVQKLQELPGGGQLKVTIALWYTPDGKNINKEGIKPDTEVKMTEDAAAKNQDPQKDKAFELLKNR
jgi:carboxyl-terminal processing protease